MKNEKKIIKKELAEIGKYDTYSWDQLLNFDPQTTQIIPLKVRIIAADAMSSVPAPIIEFIFTGTG